MLYWMRYSCFYTTGTKSFDLIVRVVLYLEAEELVDARSLGDTLDACRSQDTVEKAVEAETRELQIDDDQRTS